MTASRILVVDDEADIRGLLKEILSEEGYEVEVAADATQARSSRATQVPDLVLLDIWMPDTDGITLLREWSVTDGYDCPVVMMSGHGTVETAVEATRLGAFDFVEKPLSLTKLLRTVERALDAGRRKRLSERAQGWRVGAIEQNGYSRMGGRERLAFNVRWISSAQEGFELRAAPEPFRRDLLAHLNVITLRVPPLREYAEDVPDLLRFYVDRLVDDQHLPLRRFSVAAQNRLRNYPWPGNVGELKNLVQRVLILGVGDEIRP